MSKREYKPDRKKNRAKRAGKFESLVRRMVKQGLPRREAERRARQTLYGISA